MDKNFATNLECLLLEFLHNQCRKVLGKHMYATTKQEFKSLIVVCNVVAIASKHAELNISAEKCVEVLLSMKRKGFIVVFDDGGYPSFIPKSKSVIQIGHPEAKYHLQEVLPDEFSQ